MARYPRWLSRAGAPPATRATPSQGPSVQPPYLTGATAVGVSAVFRCVDLIAGMIADWPWTEWRGDDQLEPSRLVRRPMATMTRREWTWRVVATEALYGVSYLLHVGGTDSEGSPWSLLPVPPRSIAPVGYVDPYYLSPPSEYVVAGMNVSADDLTIIRRHPWPGVPEYMLGILSIARTQFQAYLAADFSASRYWLNGGPPTTVITTDQELDDPQADTIARRWRDRRALGADWPAVLGKGAHAEPWGADPTQQASVEARNGITADVGRYFGVPTRILNAPAMDSETYANVENDALDLYRYTLRAYAGPIEDGVSEVLPGDYLGGRRMRVDPSAFIQGNLNDRALAWSALTGAGIATIPEARVRGFGLAPVPTAPAGTTATGAPVAADAGAPAPLEPGTPMTVTAQLR